ncbi:MAG: hypothetical protein EBU90_08695 [Proteobacteria bacterium]|nr:hypothetical protein [Pseudomonadota bacterium]
MSFNIFGPASKNSIRVGYISTDRGFVDDITICEANDYAKLNPGTQFIFKTRKFIKYLNINEVNKLTPDDVLSTGSTCGGIVLDADCGYPEAHFYGGGGVGVQGNPVFGRDGSLLAVDLVHGGFGYQYPPIVEVKDNCGFGVGAVTRAVLGEIVETVEYYDQEGDFEEYEICDPTDVGYGLRYGPNGEVLGDWDPTLYANLTKDPIAIEIKEYQDFLQKLQTPWWTTRTKNPLRVTSANRTTRVKHNVTYPAWSDFLNKYAISPVPPSNAPGSDFSAEGFTLEWEEEFPYDGEYVFRGLADNRAALYLDNLKLSDLQSVTFIGENNRQDSALSVKDTPNTIRKIVKAGVHRIRVDLYNQPISPTPLPATRKVFNTVDYITKANRRLWRTNVYGRGGFINEYGVCPFDTTVQLEDNPYAGTHTIVWDNISFPADGNYIIEIEVDDNVTLKFAGQDGETVITKRGFSAGDKGTGKTTETKFFRAGTYKITADLEQIPGGKFGFSHIKGVNPMALAVNIESASTQTPVVSPRSWNENPMGIALTIDAPLPPIPQEPIPVQQEGRCPNNPIWSTRFPNGKEKWWPVKYESRSWSKFMNRYAISPIPPLSKKGSDGGGVVYKNSWNLDIPYDGFYALKGTVDNGGRILIDDKEVARGGGVSFKGGTVDTKQKLDSFKVENPQSTKLFLTKGKHTIQVEVENEKTETFEKIDKKIFSTKDWMFKPTVQPIVVQEQVDEYELQSETYIGPLRDNVVTGSKYDARVPSNWVTYGAVQLGNMARGGSSTYILGPPGVSFGTNNGFIFWGGGKIDGTVVDVGAKGPYTTGEYIQVDDQTRVTLGAFSETSAFSIPTRDGRFSRSIQSYGLHKLKVWKKKGSSQVTKEVGTTVSTAIIKQSPTAAGVVYEGPTPIANYVSDFISPVFQDVNAKPNEEIQGKTWFFRWSNVDFPVDGQYTLEAEADDKLIVRIDGVEVGQAKVFEGRRKTIFNITKGKRTVELELSNIRIPNTGFDKNPVVTYAQITVPVDVAAGISKPWTENPMGISAILIPPPCPKRIKGKGVVTEVIVDDPGNGFVPPGNGDYPVALRLKNVIVEDTGINYNCGVDQIQITPNNGAVLDYECDTFGRIVNVKVLNPGLGFTTYPEITMVTPTDNPTGINATFRPQFEIVRDPIAEPQKLIQVTDLVGLKQTGYVDGRPYYGAVFSKDGANYAGFYETPGDLVQVYATLQESINAQVTTAPSAIQRQGTDVTSNDPRLNLPGTPENLI